MVGKELRSDILKKQPFLDKRWEVSFCLTCQLLLEPIELFGTRFSVNNYYSNRHVRARMLEFLGGKSRRNATCEYITAGDREGSHHREPRPVKDLPTLWEDEMDIGRSLWDRKSLLLDLDIEYVNFDFPAESYVDPRRIFCLQRPVELAVEAVLREHGITPLHLLSGRGHHFVWRIRQRSRAFRRLVQLGRLPPGLKELNARPHRPNGNQVPSELGAAFAGTGFVMEHLAHLIKQAAAPVCEIPVELTAVEVGPRQHGREMISIDISEYGDPLSTRVIRVPFSFYLKPLQQQHLLGPEIAKSIPPMVLIPLHEMDPQQGIEVMRDLDGVCELARRATTAIPDQTQSTNSLVSAYENSSLKKFHDSFYSVEHEPADRWPLTYDCLPLDLMPLCVRHILDHPNDLLLHPANIERIVRVLLALGWHPRHIAGFIRSRFERDCGWEKLWTGYDRATRADFYTRIFAGLVITERDNLIDFNCRSAKEEKLCFVNECPFNLERYRESLLERRTHERLACRPFNRLFLSEEHLRLS